MGMLGSTDQAGFDLNWEPRLIAIGGPAADVTLSRATQALSVLSNLQNALTRALREGELEGQIDVAARAAFAEAASRAEILERQLDGVVRIAQQINETRVAATDRAVNALDAENPGYLSPHQTAIIYNAPEGTTVRWGPITVTAGPGAVAATNRMLHNNRERAAQQHIQTVAAEISGVAERLQATLSDDFKFDSGSSGETGGPGATAGSTGNPGGSSLGSGGVPGYNPYFDYPDATSNPNAEWPEGVAPTPAVPQAPSDEPTYDYPYDNDVVGQRPDTTDVDYPYDTDVVGQRPDTTYDDYSVTPDSSDDPGSRGWTGYTPNGTGNLSGGGSGYGIGSGVSSGVGSGSSSAMAGIAGAGGGAVSFAGAKMMAQGYTGGGSGLLSRSAMSGGGLRGGGAGGTGAGSAARTGGMAGAGSRGGMGLMGGGANSSAQNGGARGTAGRGGAAAGARGTAARGGATAGVRGASAGGGAASSTRGTTVNGGAASSTRGSAGNGGAASATRGSAASANGNGGARAGGAGRGGMMGGSGSNEEQRKRSHGMLNGLMAPGLEDDEQLGARSEAAGAGGRED